MRVGITEYCFYQTLPIYHWSLYLQHPCPGKNSCYNLAFGFSFIMNMSWKFENISFQTQRVVLYPKTENFRSVFSVKVKKYFFRDFRFPSFNCHDNLSSIFVKQGWYLLNYFFVAMQLYFFSIKIRVAINCSPKYISWSP